MSGKFLRKKNLLVSSILTTSLLTINIQASADEKKTIDSKKNQSITYLSKLSDDKRIVVWPTLSLSYEIINDDHQTSNLIYKYKDIRKHSINLYESTTIAQISILNIEYDLFDSEITETMKNSDLLPAYKSFVKTAKLSNDGCTTYRFTSRNTWVAVGVVIVDSRRLKPRSPNEYEQCIYSSLDYIAGFPIEGIYFNYKALPDTEVRGFILDAMRI